MSSNLYHRHLGCRHVPEQDRPCDECAGLAEDAWEAHVELQQERQEWDGWEDWRYDDED